MPFVKIRMWQVTAIVSIFSMIYGLSLLIYPEIMLKGTLCLVGIVAISIGTVGVFCNFRTIEVEKDVAYGSSLLIILGGICIAVMSFHLIVMAYLTSLQALVAGITQIAIAIELPGNPFTTPLLCLCAGVSLFLSFMLLLMPVIVFLAVVSLCGACIFVFGAVLFGFTLQFRDILSP